MEPANDPPWELERSARVAKAAHKRASDNGAARSGPTSVPGAVRRLESAETALRRADRETLRRARAVYLNGEELDRGTLRLTNHSLRFDGWQGSIVFPLPDIMDVRLGTSVLPRHAGIPLLGRLWPGKPHYAESLLITVRVGEGREPRVATVADLRNGIQWRDVILRGRDEYDAWTQERSQSVEDVEQAESDLAQARQADEPPAGRSVRDTA